MSRQERIEAQLRAWVDGNPTHNTVDNECCPDFSCCAPNLLAEPAVRQRFVNATEQERNAMLGMFLSAMLADSNTVVHIAGEGLPEQ